MVLKGAGTRAYLSRCGLNNVVFLRPRTPCLFSSCENFPRVESHPRGHCIKSGFVYVLVESF